MGRCKKNERNAGRPLKGDKPRIATSISIDSDAFNDLKKLFPVFSEGVEVAIKEYLKNIGETDE